MAEPEKPKRNHEELLKDYNHTCAKLGDTLGKIDDLQKDAEMLKSEIRSLKFEAMSLPPQTPPQAEQAPEVPVSGAV